MASDFSSVATRNSSCVRIRHGASCPFLGWILVTLDYISGSVLTKNLVLNHSTDSQLLRLGSTPSFCHPGWGLAWSGVVQASGPFQDLFRAKGAGASPQRNRQQSVCGLLQRICTHTWFKSPSVSSSKVPGNLPHQPQLSLCSMGIIAPTRFAGWV